MRKPVLTWPFVLATLLGSGCLVSRGGLPGSTQGTGGEGTSTSTSTATSAAGGAGGAGSSTSASMGGGASTGASVNASVGTGCIPTAEVCDNGVDDDCDGLIDCADPECATPIDGRACVDSAPAGWALTTVAPGVVGACPAGFANPVQIAAAPASASATCDCNCSAISANPCTQGVLTVKIGSACTANTLISPATGGCDVLPALAGTHQSCGGNPLPVVKVACGTTVTKPGPAASTVETMCAPQPSGALGCGAGQTCLPKAASRCITQSGDMACPAGPYSVRSVVGAPGDLVDNRTCAACTCSSDATSCGAATFTAYTDNCVSNPASVAIDSTCHNTVTNAFLNDTHFIYTATPNVTSCSPSSATTALTGQFAPNSPVTVCCEP